MDESDAHRRAQSPLRGPRRLAESRGCPRDVRRPAFGGGRGAAGLAGYRVRGRSRRPAPRRRRTARLRRRGNLGPHRRPGRRRAVADLRLAGGPRRVRHRRRRAGAQGSAEGAEDDRGGAKRALASLAIGARDVAIGLAASGATPYTVEFLQGARERGALTVAVANNPGAPLLASAEHPILVDTGPEVLAGSTRMKAGTAQKVVLNLLSTLV